MFAHLDNAADILRTELVNADLTHGTNIIDTIEDYG
jgi:hypothetical protein